VELLIIVLIIALIAIYFLPAMIGFSRDHRNRWIILLINVVFGATVLGWLIALIWAMNKIDDPMKGGIKYGPDKTDSSI